MAKAKQTKMSGEGFERVTDPEIEAAAEAYREVRDQRMDLTKKETAAQAALLAVMKRKNLATYVSEEREFKVAVVESSSERVSVTKFVISESGTSDDPDSNDEGV